MWLDFFLHRFCETGGLDACAVVAGDTVLAATGPFRWGELSGPVAEQGERFLCATPSAPGGVLGAAAELTSQPGTRVVVLRYFDRRLATALAERAGIEVRLVRLSNWLESVEPDLRPVVTGDPAAQTYRPVVGGGSTYGFAIDAFGNLWISQRDNYVGQYDARTGEHLETYNFTGVFGSIHTCGS